MDTFTQKIIIIGGPGAGKTAVGAALAEILMLPFWDTHEILEALLNQTTAHLLKLHGARYVAHKETVIAERILQPGAGIAVLSAGSVLVPQLRPLFKKHIIVYLKASRETLIARKAVDEETKTQIEQLLERCEPVYAMLASLTIEINHQPADQLAQVIVQQLGLDATESMVTVEIEE